MRIVVWVVLMGLVLACGPSDQEVPPPTDDSQTSYAYPGCADGQLQCPQDVTLLCALDQIQSAHATCQVDSDCVLVELSGSCFSAGSCPPMAVAIGSEEGFESAARGEIDAYCASASCEDERPCSIDPDAVRAACVAGACIAEVDAEP